MVPPTPGLYGPGKSPFQVSHMDRRALLTRLLAAPLLPLALSGCQPDRRLSLGIHPWPGYEPLYLAREFGWLPASVRLQEGRNASDSLEGLRRGALDGAALTLDEVLSARADGVPLTVCLVFNDSVGADALLVRPGIGSLAELAGRRLAVERTAVGRLVLAKVFAASGLAPSDVTLVDLPPDRQLTAWRSGGIDAAISYEPTATRLEREGAVRLFDSRHFPGLILDVLALRRDRLLWYDAAIDKLIAAHFRGLAHLRHSREDALHRIAAWRDLSFAEAKATYAGMALPDRAGNRRYFGPQGKLRETARTLQALLGTPGDRLSTDRLDDLASDHYLGDA
ncbi:nitrate ABC transporter substrate-binding protein [Billgrantia azerbaijanica]|nr:nitrate ABC transporter substrate-binding protein [Halomonas azerbaijanica]